MHILKSIEETRKELKSELESIVEDFKDECRKKGLGNFDKKNN